MKAYKINDIQIPTTDDATNKETLCEIDVDLGNRDFGASRAYKRARKGLKRILKQGIEPPPTTLPSRNSREA
ncbi:hypothetical protein PG999_000100 [Apiospora kogelbergensis]|uniref:Uncharacterized protein n=1 Tax=Apiospora kogelbergensis TaxID=1337665 RepID=A0AAW0RAI4_9PEZI